MGECINIIIDLRANRNFRNAFANQLSPPDGTIYVNLQKSLQDNDLAETEQWRAYLTTNKRRYLRQLSNTHGGIIDAFNQLLFMEPLFLGKHAFHIGIFHKLVNLRCDEVPLAFCRDLILSLTRISEIN